MNTPQMTIQTIELGGRRFVIIPEEDFQKLSKNSGNLDSPAKSEAQRQAAFDDFIPLKVSGMPASKMLIQDRR